jgi:homoserine kinase
LHQGHRAEMMPKSFELLLKLRQAGLPAAVSGAGPSVVAFIPRAQGDFAGQDVGALNDLAAGKFDVLELGFDTQGARVEPLE